MSGLAVLAEGEGPRAVVLLHGVGGGRRIWGEEGSGTTTALAEAGYTALAFDLPGYGESDPSEDLTLSSMAQAVWETLEARGIHEAVWVGHSMGGMVAQEAALAHPQAVCALVLACTSAAFGRSDGAWQQAFVRDRLAPLDQGNDMSQVARKLVPGLVAPGARPEALDMAMRLMSAVPVPTYRQAVSALVGFDSRSRLSQIAVPALCLAGDQDSTSPPEVLQRMAQRLPGGRYACLSKAGHIANLEQPEAFNQAVIDFLAEVAPASPSTLMGLEHHVQDSSHRRS